MSQLMQLITKTSESGKTKYFGVEDELGNEFMFSSKKQALHFITTQTSKDNAIQQYLQCELNKPCSSTNEDTTTTTCSCREGVRDFSELTPKEKEQNNQAIAVVLEARARAREATARANEATARANEATARANEARANVHAQIHELLDTDRELEQRRSEIERLRKVVGSGHGHRARQLEPETVDVSSEEW